MYLRNSRATSAIKQLPLQITKELSKHIMHSTQWKGAGRALAPAEETYSCHFSYLCVTIKDYTSSMSPCCFPPTQAAKLKRPLIKFHRANLPDTETQTCRQRLKTSSEKHFLLTSAPVSVFSNETH